MYIQSKSLLLVRVIFTNSLLIYSTTVFNVPGTAYHSGNSLPAGSKAKEYACEVLFL